MAPEKLRTYGLRHVALNVDDAQKSKEFYTRVLKMTVEWEPDPDNVYLTSESRDNLALHKATPGSLAGVQRLDHIGFMLPQIEDVDAWYAHTKNEGVKVVREIKTHRDGARSFYFEDIDGVVIQMIYHPPVSNREK